ncbi:MAG: epoxyqueuosine reductase QueH [Clostridia bacterium]|nr:epoxyqueuosine reductase QueH [Clostridia bacterium]
MVKNYNKEMQNIILQLQKEKKKPTLLLHSCCAPCSSSVIERLKPYFEITVYYYNPNIDSLEEYQLRFNEQKRLCELLGVNFFGEQHLKEQFLNCVKGYEKEVEGGSRCKLCFNLRLNKTAEFASNNGYEFFTTTLSVSPLKNSALLNEIGFEIAKEKKVKFLYADFKKQNGYIRSIELSKEYGLYRQNYCGCEFSKR